MWICCLHLQRQRRNYCFTLKHQLAGSSEINYKFLTFTWRHIPEGSICLVFGARTSNFLKRTIFITNMTTKSNKIRQATYVKLYINYQLDAQIITYLYNITFLYTDLWSVLTQSLYRPPTTTARKECRYYMLHVYSVTS